MTVPREACYQQLPMLPKKRNETNSPTTYTMPVNGEIMRTSSRWRSLMVALLGLMLLFWYLTQPRVQMLHGADIVGLMGCGACLGIGIAGLFGRLKLRNV
jgi:hypothetical protein